MVRAAASVCANLSTDGAVWTTTTTITTDQQMASSSTLQAKQCLMCFLEAVSSFTSQLLSAFSLVPPATSEWNKVVRKKVERVVLGDLILSDPRYRVHVQTLQCSASSSVRLAAAAAESSNANRMVHWSSHLQS